MVRRACTYYISEFSRAMVLFFLLLVLLLTGQTFSQCFTGSGCTGGQVAADSERGCCVGTNDGLSYNGGGSCTVCIGIDF